MDPTLSIAVRAAREAGKLIARSSDRLSQDMIFEKSANNYSTSVDQAAEAAIIKVISQAYPDHSFLAEEGGLLQNANPDALWIIDPLDGTTNFIHGLPNYVVSIAFQFKGVLEYGVIYHPLTQDLFTAGRGKGAQLNDTRIRVSQHTKFEGALISAGLPRPANYLKTYLEFNQKLQGRVAGIRRSGASALDLAYVAAGKLDLFWCIDSKIWDIAAGAVLIKEAGGVIGYPDATDTLENGHIVAGNSKIVKSAVELLRPCLPR